MFGMRILITGARAPVALDLARQFYRAGHSVVMADSIRMPLSRWSRCIEKTIRVAAPALDLEQFTSDLIEGVQKHRIDWIVPTCEEIFYLASRIDRFQGRCRVFAEPLPVLAAMHNKWEFAKCTLRLAHEVVAPETHYFDSNVELREWSRSQDATEWVFKPVFSRFAARTLIGPTTDALDQIVPTPSDPWIAQKKVIGREYSTYSIAHDGRLSGHACYWSKYRAGLGAGIYFCPYREERIRSFVAHFVRHRRFTGQIGFDFMEDTDGTMYVLECNPRATSGLHLLCDQPVANAIFGPLEREPPCIEPTMHSQRMLASIMMLYAVLPSIRSPVHRVVSRFHASPGHPIRMAGSAPYAVGTTLADRSDSGRTKDRQAAYACLDL